MRVSLFISAVLFFGACQGNSKEETALVSEEPAAAIGEAAPAARCFQRIEGTNNQDTATLHLFITGDIVQGEFIHKPFEKDKRSGTIAGKRKGNGFTGMWTFTQEGVQDSLPVAFELADGKLFQRAYSVDSKTGNEFLSDTSRLTLEFKKIACKGNGW